MINQTNETFRIPPQNVRANREGKDIEEKVGEKRVM